MSCRRFRSKGVRTERAIVNALLANGITAVRVPLFGAVGGRFAGVEVKCRRLGFRELYSWLDERDVLIIKAARWEPLVLLRLSLAAELLNGGAG